MSWRVLRALAALWPLSTPADPDLRRAVGFLEWRVDADTLLAASYAAAVLVSVAGLLAQVLVGSTLGVAAAVVGLVAGAGLLAAKSLVVGLAGLRRARALGGAPELLTRIAFRMQTTPAPEAAARFGARAEGALAASLGGHVRRTANGPGTGLRSFAREWRPWFPELERACSLVESAGHAPADERVATLERARDVVLDGVHDRTTEFAASIKGPATALYAFGVMLPLSLVALLPALDAAGVPATLPLLVVVYDGVLPVAVVAGSAWLLSQRPLAFRPTRVPRSHPDVWSSRWHAVVAAVAVAAVAWVLSPMVASPWTAPISALGAGSGAGLVVAYQPMRAVRADADAVEDGLADALTLIGRRVARGAAAEHALDAVAAETPGATGDVLAAAARRQRRLGVALEPAFTGPEGALATVPSDRAESAAALLSLAATEGRPAGDALVAMGEHFERLDEVEARSKRAVAQVTSTLSNTAAVFGPLVGGATVALTDAMGAAGPLGGEIATADLGVAVGWYVLVLAAVLTALATGLTHGLDRSLVGYRVGLALLSATATFLAAVVGAGLLV